ncbi:MAG: hypothetical protein ACOX7B_03255 [Christensenellales bacterium]|jgi:hypothetical protein
MALTKEKLEYLINSGQIALPGSNKIAFNLDIETGMIMVTIPDNYDGAIFAVNPETGKLEVTIS